MKINIKNQTIKNVTAISIFAIFSFYNFALAGEITIPSVIRYVNESREAQGLVELKENEKLSKIAADKANDMIKNNYFAHTSPAGLTPWYWFEKEGYDYKYAGENLAINFKTAEEQHKAWMASLTHRKNILNTNFSEIGVAVAAGEINGQMAIVTVQEFGSISGETAPINDKKNFSAEEKNNVIKEGTKIAPAVLSVKDLIDENIKGKKLASPAEEKTSFLKQLADGFRNNKDLIGEYLMMLAGFLVALVFTVTPLTFLALSLNKILDVFEMKREAQLVLKYTQSPNGHRG